MNFTPQQQDAISAIKLWLETEAPAKQIFRLFGYAGTGKTTLARHIAEEAAENNVCYAAFTGKAALQMRRTGCTGASTIHSLIYSPVEGENGEFAFIWNPDSNAKHTKLIIIDECSMVDDELAADLLRYGKPILVLGDPAQLPPVSGAGYFTEAMPDKMLTEIHRQAEGNPIIEMATAVRKGELIPDHLRNSTTTRIVSRGTLGIEDVLKADQLIVGRNVTRQSFNVRIRKHLGRKTLLPEPNDRLVCLRNDHSLRIFNGGLFTAEKAKVNKTVVRITVASEDFPDRKPFPVNVRKEFFTGGIENIDWKELKGTQQFDYGYALTCHKSQGSQWPYIIVYDESSVFREDAHRWLYTAITRAADKLILVQ